MFALSSAFFFEPIPFGEQDRLVLLSELRRGESIEDANGVSVHNYRDLETTGAAAELAAFTTEVVNLTGQEQAEQIRVVTGTPDLFEVLRIPRGSGRAARVELVRALLAE